MTRKALPLLLCAAALSACDLLTGDFRLSGTVHIAPGLKERAPRQNSMLFIVAKNAGGVPVAVHRVVNPVFPAPFRMGPEDLLVPAVRGQEPLSVSAEMNAHGQVGKPRPGDLETRAPAGAKPGDGGVRLTLDRIVR